MVKNLPAVWKTQVWSLEGHNDYFRNGQPIRFKPVRINPVILLLWRDTAVVMYGYERWIITKAECCRTDAFELWCWRRLESPLDCKEIKPVNSKGNQPWIFTGRTDAEAEAPILWPPDVNSRLTGKTLMLGKIEGRTRRGRQRMRWLHSITDSTNMRLSKVWEIAKDREAWHAAVSMESQSLMWLSYWTELENCSPNGLEIRYTCKLHSNFRRPGMKKKKLKSS